MSIRADFLSAATTGLKMLRSPRELPAMVVALTVGVGLTIAVFSLIHAVLFAPLPYRNPENLVRVWTASNETVGTRALSEAEQSSLAEAPSPFRGIASYETTRQFVQRGPEASPVEIRGALVSANLFDVLGVTAAQGRTFVAAEQWVTNTPPIVVSARTIRSGVVSGSLGELVRLDNTTYRLIGIMPDEFWFPDRQTSYWVPLPNTAPISSDANGAVTRSFPVVARLATDVSRAAAESQVRARLQGLGLPLEANRVRVESYAETLSAPVRPALLVLQAASGLVLLLVCLNVGWLYAARAQRLRPAFTTMRALGATPGQVVTTHLVSAACVAAMAVPSAILVAWLLVRFGLTLESGVFSQAAEPAITWHVMTVAFIVTVLAGVGSCLPGAFIVSRWNGSLNDAPRTTMRGRRLERSVMAAQIGLVFTAGAQGVLVSLVLLSLARANVGLPRADFLVVSLVVRDGPIEDPVLQLERYKQLLERLDRRGIRAAAANIFPLTQSDHAGTFEPRRSREHRRAMVRTRIVTSSYFPLVGLTATAGRLLGDVDAGSRHIVVTDAFARSVLQSRHPIGARTGNRGEWTIVGVAPAVRQFGIHEEATPEAYVLFDDFVATQPNAANELRRIHVLARSGPDVASTLRIIRGEITAQVPGAEVQSASHIRDLIDLSLGVNRLVAAGSVVFAAVAFFLAAVGVYAMVSHGLELRRREFGVRIALGATTGRIVLDSVRPIAAVYGAGVVLGLLLLLSAHSAIRSVMVPPPEGAYPPLFAVIGSAATALLAIVVLACYRPVKTAARTDPVVSLRSE